MRYCTTAWWRSCSKSLGLMTAHSWDHDCKLERVRQFKRSAYGTLTADFMWQLNEIRAFSGTYLISKTNTLHGAATLISTCTVPLQVWPSRPFFSLPTSPMHGASAWSSIASRRWSPASTSSLWDTKSSRHPSQNTTRNFYSRWGRGVTWNKSVFPEQQIYYKAKYQLYLVYYHLCSAICHRDGRRLSRVGIVYYHLCSAICHRPRLTW